MMETCSSSEEDLLDEAQIEVIVDQPIVPQDNPSQNQGETDSHVRALGD